MVDMDNLKQDLPVLLRKVGAELHDLIIPDMQAHGHILDDIRRTIEMNALLVPRDGNDDGAVLVLISIRKATPDDIAAAKAAKAQSIQ
jgi:hypothetical protein